MVKLTDTVHRGLTSLITKASTAGEAGHNIKDGIRNHLDFKKNVNCYEYFFIKTTIAPPITISIGHKSINILWKLRYKPIREIKLIHQTQHHHEIIFISIKFPRRDERRILTELFRQSLAAIHTVDFFFASNLHNIPPGGYIMTHRITSLLGGVIILLSTTALAAQEQPTIETRVKPRVHVGALDFKDLNANGILDPYEDWRLTPAHKEPRILSDA